MNKDQVYLTKKYRQYGNEHKRYIFDGIWFNPDLNRYVKSWRGKRSKLIKRTCNKKFRKMSIDIGREKSQYKKHTMFWWELY